MRSLSHSFPHQAIHSLTRSFIHSLTQPLTHSAVYSFIPSPSHSLIRSFIHQSFKFAQFSHHIEGNANSLWSCEGGPIGPPLTSPLSWPVSSFMLPHPPGILVILPHSTLSRQGFCAYKVRPGRELCKRQLYDGAATDSCESSNGGINPGRLPGEGNWDWLFKNLFYFIAFLPFQGLLLRHMEVLRLGVKSEL